MVDISASSTRSFGVQRRMTMLLCGWAFGSMILALIGFMVEPNLSSNFLALVVRGVAAECLGWGLIEVAAALVALQQMQSASRRGRYQGMSPKLDRLFRFII